MTEPSRDPATIPLRVYRCGDQVRATGTREQLLEAGIVGPETPFPGDHGQRKTFVRLADDPRRVRHIKPAGRGRFTVHAMRHEAEVTAERIRDAQRAAELERLNDAAAARRVLERAPRSFEAFRAGRVDMCGTVLRLLSHHVAKSDHGYRFAPDVVDEVAGHLAAVGALVETGTITFDPAARDAERARLHAVAAHGDDAFDRFMRQAKARG